ncbi:MAG: hypothetical protein ACP5TV_09250 [Anaerolineae bacterium]
MGKPEVPAEFTPVELWEDDQPFATAYLAPEIWEKITPGQEELVFYVSEYGRFRMELEWE